MPSLGPHLRPSLQKPRDAGLWISLEGRASRSHGEAKGPQQSRQIFVQPQATAARQKDGGIGRKMLGVNGIGNGCPRKEQVKERTRKAEARTKVRAKARSLEKMGFQLRLPQGHPLEVVDILTLASMLSTLGSYLLLHLHPLLQSQPQQESKQLFPKLLLHW